jgi:hypothetical protein
MTILSSPDGRVTRLIWSFHDHPDVEDCGGNGMCIQDAAQCMRARRDMGQMTAVLVDRVE